MRSAHASALRGGFTLIEVVGALVILSAGVLMIMGLTRALSDQLNHSAARSVLSAEVNQRLDSLAQVPFDSLAAGSTRTDTLRIQGRIFLRTHRILQQTPAVKEVEVQGRASDGRGPRLTRTAFVTKPW